MGKSNGCLLGTDQVLPHTAGEGVNTGQYWGCGAEYCSFFPPRKSWSGCGWGGACFTRTPLSVLVRIKIFGPKEKGDQVIIVSNLYLDQVLICRLGKNCSNDRSQFFLVVVMKCFSCKKHLHDPTQTTSTERQALNKGRLLPPKRMIFEKCSLESRLNLP